MKVAQSAPGELHGTNLIAGRYRIEGALGRGGAAQVLKVKDLARGGVSVALKRLAWDAKPRLAAQFELEYQTLASLKHPRIVEVFDYGRDSEGAFYTMELLEGEDLRDHAPISWREACAYLRDAAQALSLLHARRLVHRDVGPRNLWRCPDGALKLIDFGALTGFGPVNHLMGTPPFIPPEALHAQELDQRADLYALGALAYYLLTGVHAYPASDPRELPELWQRPPAAPSVCVAELARPDLEQVPAELDGLVDALLSKNVLARPHSAAEVIDRLDALLGASSSQSELGHVHLSNAALVGRERELQRLRRYLALASRGRGRSCVIEGASGLGRSRMLRELELLARVSEVSVLQVDAAHALGAYGAAGALALKLLEAAPEVARAAAAPHAALLSQLSPQLRKRLALPAPRARRADPDLAVRIQSALCSWFLQVAKNRPLLILVDGLELLDPGSSAFLLALMLSLGRSSVLVVGTLLTGVGASTVAERELAKASRRLALSPLSDDQTLTLMESVFGRVEHVARLTSHLQRTARGNPGHLLDLCGQLLQRNVIGFVGGAWVLPLDLPEGELSRTRREILHQRLQALSAEARELARVLSVHDQLITPALYRSLAAVAVDDPFRKLGELLELEVLCQEHDGLRFRHEEVRRALYAELPSERRSRVRRALGEHLLAQPEIGLLTRLRAGVHLLAGGDARGAELVTAAGRQITSSEIVQLSAALPDLEEALSLFREQQRPSPEQLCLLVPLAIAGFRVHRRYALRYGEETVLALEQLLGLDKARRLRPSLGARLSLCAGLAYGAAAAHARRKNRRALSFKAGLPLLFNSVAALSAAAGTCLDVPAARRYAHVLEPFSAALGTKQLAGFTHDFCRVMAESTSDQPGRNYQGALDMLRRLEHGERIRGLSKGLLARYVDGVLLAKGALEAQRDDALALATAQRLAESRFVLSQLSAEQIRGLYYAHQGNVAMFERCRQRAEHLAIQQGATWQVETWATCASTAMYMRLHDAMGMKQACEQLDRLSRDNPPLELHARRARGAYLMMRGRYAEAAPWLEGCLREEPRTVAGWARALGCLARVRNRTGDHAGARDLCLRVTRELDRADLDYQAFNLLVETELAIAHAGLGQAAAARRAIARLLSRHGRKPGPLTRGEIHEAGLEVELLLADRARAVQHLVEMKRWYALTGAASLAQRCEELDKRLNPAPRRSDAEQRELSVISNGSFATASRRLNTVDRVLAGGRMSLVERAQRALQILAEKCESARGALYLLDASGQLTLSARLDALEVDPAADAWARERVVKAAAEDGTVVIERGAELDGDQDLFEHRARFYRLLPLHAVGAGVQRVVGAALLMADQGYPRACPLEVTHAVGHHLQRALQRDQSASLL